MSSASGRGGRGRGEPTGVAQSTVLPGRRLVNRSRSWTVAPGGHRSFPVLRSTVARDRVPSSQTREQAALDLPGTLVAAPAGRRSPHGEMEIVPARPGIHGDHAVVVHGEVRAERHRRPLPLDDEHFVNLGRHGASPFVAAGYRASRGLRRRTDLHDVPEAARGDHDGVDAVWRQEDAAVCERLHHPPRHGLGEDSVAAPAVEEAEIRPNPRRRWRRCAPRRRPRGRGERRRRSRGGGRSSRGNQGSISACWRAPP
jgi:hypothetical protein